MFIKGVVLTILLKPKVRSWHRADMLTELEVRYERKADAGVLCKNPVCVGLH